MRLAICVLASCVLSLVLGQLCSHFLPDGIGLGVAILGGMVIGFVGVRIGFSWQEGKR